MTKTAVTQVSLRTRSRQVGRRELLRATRASSSSAPPADVGDPSASRSIVGAGSCACDAHEVGRVRAGGRARFAHGNRPTCSKTQPGRARSPRARSPRATRAAAPTSWLSPGSMPPPGVPHHVRSPIGRRNWTSSTRSSASSTSARTACRSTGTSQSRSARNQRSRSAYGTAAFAGDVDGSTKSRCAERRAPAGRARAARQQAAVGLLADERDRARRDGLDPRLELGPVEVAAPQVARPGRRAVGGVGHP